MQHKRKHTQVLQKSPFNIYLPKVHAWQCFIDALLKVINGPFFCCLVSFPNVIKTKRLKDRLFENLVSYKGEVWVQQMETINVSPGFICQAHPTLIFCQDIKQSKLQISFVFLFINLLLSFMFFIFMFQQHQTINMHLQIRNTNKNQDTYLSKYLQFIDKELCRLQRDLIHIMSASISIHVPILHQIQ